MNRRGRSILTPIVPIVSSPATRSLWARGRLATGTGAPGEESSELRAAQVWQGGVSLIDRPFMFTMKRDAASTAVANAVAQRINVAFQEDPRRLEKLSQEQSCLMLLGTVNRQINQKFEGMGRTDMAKAAGKDGLHVRVPLAYRFNPQHYLLVARNTPLRSETPEVARRYRSRLQKMLADPKQTLRAAFVWRPWARTAYRSSRKD